MKVKGYYKKICNFLFAQLQYLIPHKCISRLTGSIANCQNRWVKNLFIKSFIYYYPVNLTEAESDDINKYLSFNHFFTRHLKKHVRNFDSDINTIASPVDGIVEQYGTLTLSATLNVKKAHFDLSRLLGNDAPLAEYFNQGQFITLYLAPQHYHRVHMPIAAKLLRMIYIPGRLFSVNHISAQYIPNIFSRNERVICLFETVRGGLIAIILVGALNVGSISVKWHGPVISHNRKIESWDYSEKNIFLEKGDELGHFAMGSTVILLFTDQRIAWHNYLGEKKISI